MMGSDRPLPKTAGNIIVVGDYSFSIAGFPGYRLESSVREVQVGVQRFVPVAEGK